MKVVSILKSIVKDMNLAKEGKKRIEWVETYMPVLKEIGKELKESGILKGKKIGMCIHLEPKTCVLAKVLHEAGAEVCMTGCNPLSVQDSAAAAATEFATVFAWRGMTTEEYYENIDRMLEWGPDVLIDDGADAIWRIHEKYPELAKKIFGASEETTTGVNRLRAMDEKGVLKFPVIAVNDSNMKYLFDNRYGTGESALYGFLNATNLTIRGKNTVVAGFGWVGRGIAKNLRALGARVTITEVNPVRAVEAFFEGFDVKKMSDAVKDADIVITATGVKDIVTKEHFEKTKDGAIFCNAGHFNNEVNLEDLDTLTKDKEDIRFFGEPYNSYLITKYKLKNGRTIFVIGQGRLVNLVAGQGHATEYMDLSFAIQALSVKELIEQRGKLKTKVYDVPEEVDNKVALIKLKSAGCNIDELTEEQLKYINDFAEGT